MFYVGFRNGRVLWGTEFFSLILLLKIFEEKRWKAPIITYITYLLLTLLSAHFSWILYRSGEVRNQYDEVIALYLQSSDGVVYYDLHSEPKLVMNYIPTPLCRYNQFELSTISLFYTKNEKRLRISSHKNKER